MRETREAALDRLGDALDRTVVAGPRTNLAFLAALCRAPDFRAGQFDTGFIERHHAELGLDASGHRCAPPPRAALLHLIVARAAEAAKPERRRRPGMSPMAFSSRARERLALPILVERRAGRRRCSIFRRADGASRWMARRPTWTRC